MLRSKTLQCLKQIDVLVALLLLVGQVARGDSVYTGNAKLLGTVTAMSASGLTLRRGCTDGEEQTFQWSDVRYVVFDNNCLGSGPPGDGYGRSNEFGACQSRKQRFWRVEFNHPSAEPYIFVRGLQMTADGELQIDTVSQGTFQGPRTRVRSIEPQMRCPSDPTLNKGSLPRDYQPQRGGGG